MTNLVQFTKFLKENRCYSKFVKNLQLRPIDTEYKFYIVNSDLSNPIDGAFHWEETPEGHYFWENIRNKWNKKRGR